MTEVVIVPNRMYGFDSEAYRVFLAGAIDMGKAPDWQNEVIACLQGYNNMAIFNPRRKNDDYTPDTLDEQIEWELRELDQADCVFLWFPHESFAPVSMLEAGLFWKSGKLILGAEQGFYRRRNLEITTRHYNYPFTLHDNLSDMIHELKLNYSMWETGA